MIVALDIQNSQIKNLEVLKIHEQDKSTALCAKLQYLLRYHMLQLFEEHMKSGREENLQLLKETVSLIRRYSRLHKEFMLARETSDSKEIFDDILKNHPEKILDESLWR